jgi:hypothetical protein
LPDHRISDADREAVSRSIKQTKLVEASRKMARMVKHTDPSPQVKAARTRLEKSLVKWMKRHGGDAFDQPFSKDHKLVLAKIEEAINNGGLFALAMPRGHGKTTILKWATLYCMLTGRRSFVVVVAATTEMAQGIIEFCRQQIQESETLDAHYPHVTTYARATDGKAIKAKFQLRSDGKSSGIQWSKNTLVFPEVLDKNGKPYPSNGAILEGHGLTGAIRGKWKDTKSGKTIRPDFVLCDDPQTRESAESESQCNMRERIITGDVLGLAGPRKKIAAVMPCTIIKRGDLSDRFLDHEKHPEWSGVTTQLVNKWPDAQDTLWEDYGRLYRDGIADGDGPAAATEFYAEHRKEMDKGADVSWEHRVRDGELSAVQTAENLLIESGDQFWAEYQNDPKALISTVYTLTPELVQSRTDDKRAAGVVPEWAQHIIAATDVNPSYALSSTIVAFGEDQRAAVLWYGLYKSAPIPIDGEATAIEKSRKIYDALAKHGRELAALPCRPDAWVIDGGGSPQGTVVRFASSSVDICGLKAVCSFGRGWRNYRPTTRQGRKITVREQLHHVHVRRDEQWIVYNADYWREIAQRGWTGEVGSGGSCTLPKGRHQEFAEQICREQLEAKDEVGGREVWIWNTLPGAHDFGDCMQMAYMGEALIGKGTGAMTQNRKRKVRKRSVKHIGV